MEKIECQHAPICAMTWQHGPTLLFVSCAKKDSLCGTVMMGLNLRCLDQCHGVRCHGTSSLQGWCKRIVVFRFSQESLPTEAQKEVLYSLNLIHEFTSLFSLKVIFAGLPGKAFPRKHAFVFISVFLWLRKQRPRFAQGQPKGYFQTKELHRTTQAIAQMNAD